MTRFVTPEIVAVETKDGLTYKDLASVMAECGMDINKVVYVDSRRFLNAFFADFEQGHYCWIPFQKANLKDILSTVSKRFQSPSNGMALRNRDWTSFYLLDVPLPMQIYDFERRYRDIEPDKVFSVWSAVLTCIDYATGMWSSEVLD